MIRASEHREMLETMLARYGLPPTSLEIVPDVQAWSHANGVEERNPSRAAKCFYAPDAPCHIVMRDEQTDSMIASAKAAMLTHGFVDELEALDSDLAYLKHLMLHEIACQTLQTSEQEARDEWAFMELKNHVAA